MPLGRKALSIAGSDSGGGAGIQADLKTFAAFGVYGASAVTAVTAQNTLAVSGVHPMPAEVVAAQLDAVLGDLGADAIKTGMLAKGAIVEVVAQRLRDRANVVVDPVLASSSGTPLLDEAGVGALKRELLPLALIVTPNLPEAAALTGRSDPREAARAIHDLGPRGFTVFQGERVDTAHTHGTGCTFSAAIAAGLALGKAVPEAVDGAKRYVTAALKQAYAVGRGTSPVNHFPKPGKGWYTAAQYGSSDTPG